LEHPDIIRLEALVRSDNGKIIGMITLFVNGGTFEDYPKSPMRKQWLIQIEDALSFCSKRGFVYSNHVVWLYIIIFMVDDLINTIILKTKLQEIICCTSHCSEPIYLFAIVTTAITIADVLRTWRSLDCNRFITCNTDIICSKCCLTLCCSTPMYNAHTQDKYLLTA